MLNKVHLIGHLGGDPEIGATHNGQGQPFAKFSVATSERWRDKKSGDRKERTEWHRIVVFGDQLADTCGKYLKKGSKVWIEGKLSNRKWTDKQGIDRYITEIVIQQFAGTITFLDSAERAPEPNPDDYGQERAFA